MKPLTEMTVEELAEQKFRCMNDVLAEYWTDVEQAPFQYPEDMLSALNRIMLIPAAMVEELGKRIPDGTTLYSVIGTKHVVGSDHIDLDTRENNGVKYIGYGLLAAVPQPPEPAPLDPDIIAEMNQPIESFVEGADGESTPFLFDDEVPVSGVSLPDIKSE